jgi:hypothetical protein
MSLILRLFNTCPETSRQLYKIEQVHCQEPNVVLFYYYLLRVGQDGYEKYLEEQTTTVRDKK